MTDIQVGREEYLSCAETAKLVRKALARNFPGYTFSVRSNTYAGGASIDVGWTDGPPAKVVDGVVRQYAGGGFDGMIDMAYNVDHWLEPDGTAKIAYSPGTEGSRGVHPSVMSDPPSPNARLVSFGADHVITQRHLTPEAEALIKAKTIEKRPWYETVEPYEQQRLEHQIAQRWLFPPCEFTFSVGRYKDGKFVAEAEGIPSKKLADAKAKELQSADRRGGWRYIQRHRVD